MRVGTHRSSHWQRRIDLGLGTGGSPTNLFSVNFPEDNLAVALGNGRFAVTGQLGGTVSVGGLEIGRPIDIDIQIPRAASMMSSSSLRQEQSVRNSFMAVPRKSSSDNETGGRHRAPLREAITKVKTAVDKVVKPKHATEDSVATRTRVTQQELVEDAVVFDRERFVERHARIASASRPSASTTAFTME